MGQPLRIGFYSPFLGSTVGGGEKYFGAAVEAIRGAFPEMVIEVLTPVPVDVETYQQMLGLDLHDISFRAIYRSRGGMKGRLNRIPMLRRYRDLAVSIRAARETRTYDLLISMVYVLPAFSRARRGIILCQFPYELTALPRHHGLVAVAHKLYVRPYLGMRRLLLGGEIDDFDEVICQSEYVQRWVKRLWHRDSLVVTPPIDVPEVDPDWEAKRNVILSVGRFFAGGHNKRHDFLTRTFRQLCDDGLHGWELHLVGSLHLTTQADANYFERVRELAAGYPVHIHHDASREEVERLYREASIYWHAAGHGVDEQAHPAELEHFGMTTVEAMALGAVPVVIARGGQAEVVDQALTGYLWNEPEELMARTLALTEDTQLRRQLGQAARQASFRFSRARFVREMVDAVRPLVESLRSEAGAHIPA